MSKGNLNRIQIYQEAITEANRFVEKAIIAVEVMQSEDFYPGGRATAAAKRASMDLTMLLAEMRKTNLF